MNLWKVYCYTDPNDKKYVGMTKRTLYDRAGKNGRFYIQENNAFGKAIEKFGFNYFKPEILRENLTWEEAKELEQYYIKKFNCIKNGYNDAEGGGSCDNLDYEKICELWNDGKAIQEICDIMKCSSTSVRWALNSYDVDGMERIKRQAGQYHAKKAYQYDLEGNYIGEYQSISEAGRITQIPYQNILKCILGERKSAGGFQWKENFFEKIPPYKRKSNSKKIYQYDENLNLIKIWDTVANAAKELHYGETYLAKLARSNQKGYGFIWSYEELK